MFNLFKKKEPQKQESPFPALRYHLVGNAQINEWPQGDADGLPWALFVEARRKLMAKDNAGAEKVYRQIVETPGLESRHYLQAWLFMRYLLKIQPPVEIAKKVYGVTVEVCTPTGVMLVAGYEDHHARSLHSSGGGVFWEKPDNSLNDKIDALIQAGQSAVNAIPLVLVDMMPNPPKQMDFILICIATPNGLYHGLGNGDFMSKDAYAGPIVSASTDLLQSLQSLKK